MIPRIRAMQRFFAVLLAPVEVSELNQVFDP